MMISSLFVGLMFLITPELCIGQGDPTDTNPGAISSPVTTVPPAEKPNGTQCYSCKGVNHPAFCSEQMFCPQEECFTDELVTENIKSYNMGCRSHEFCAFYNELVNQANPVVGRRQVHVITKCSACCQKNGCNNNICSDAYQSCYQYLQHGFVQSGPYIIDFHDGSASFVGYCDMETDGGGWLVIQRRIDGSENFFRNWTEYAHGFGNVSGEFWIGNDVLNRLQHQNLKHLRIDMRDATGTATYAKYSSFSVDDGKHNYRLHISGYSGNAGDALATTSSFLLTHNNQYFSTYDSDHDKSSANCATEAKGGWWYSDCFLANLNGPYGVSNGQGIEWNQGHGSHPRTFVEMKIRER